MFLPLGTAGADTCWARALSVSVSQSLSVCLSLSLCLCLSLSQPSTVPPAINSHKTSLCSVMHSPPFLFVSVYRPSEPHGTREDSRQPLQLARHHGGTLLAPLQGAASQHQRLQMDVPLETPGEVSPVGGVERATFQPAGVTATAALSSRGGMVPPATRPRVLLGPHPSLRAAGGGFHPPRVNPHPFSI